MRKLIIAGILLAGLAPALHAQQGDDQTAKSEEQAEKREKAALDRQYRNALKNMQGPDSQKKNDPWATMRAPSQGKR